jgi:hypothetical protein
MPSSVPASPEQRPHPGDDPVRPVLVSGTFTSLADGCDHILHFGGWSGLSKPNGATRPD